MSDTEESIKIELLTKLLNYHQSRKLSHLGSCLSCFDILFTLFFKQISEQDHFILSKGHAVSLLYLILNKKGFLRDKDLELSCQNGSHLGAHPPFKFQIHKTWLPFGAGSLGYGLGLAAGVALRKKSILDHSKVYVLISEGDLNSGSSFEALQFIARYNLNKIAICLDFNGYQAISKSEDIFNINPIKSYLNSLGYFIWEGSGHSNPDQAFQSMQLNQPNFFIFHTQKNKNFESLISPLEAHYQTPKKGIL